MALTQGNDTIFYGIIKMYTNDSGEDIRDPLIFTTDFNDFFNRIDRFIYDYYYPSSDDSVEKIIKSYSKMKLLLFKSDEARPNFKDIETLILCNQCSIIELNGFDVDVKGSYSINTETVFKIPLFDKIQLYHNEQSTLSNKSREDLINYIIDKDIPVKYAYKLHSWILNEVVDYEKSLILDEFK